MTFHPGGKVSCTNTVVTGMRYEPLTGSSCTCPISFSTFVRRVHGSCANSIGVNIPGSIVASGYSWEGGAKVKGNDSGIQFVLLRTLDPSLRYGVDSPRLLHRRCSIISSCSIAITVVLLQAQRALPPRTSTHPAFCPYRPKLRRDLYEFNAMGHGN